MTRIIAGFAGSLRLDVPGAGTRPTSDRVREAIFSSLDARDAVRGAHVLDLYAGSGALGLEAASRGAASVTLVDKARPAVTACRRNAARVEAAAPAGSLTVDVVAQSAPTYLAASTAQWNLALLDPPYDLSEASLAETLALLVPRLAQDAVILVERDSRSPEPTWPGGITPTRSAKYGDTVLWWADADHSDQSVLALAPQALG